MKKLLSNIFIFFIFSSIGLSLPLASAITFTETRSKTLGHSVTASYTFTDTVAEGTSTYKWYVADDALGNNERLIPGSNGKTYQVVDSVLGHYLAFEVTPVNKNGLIGNALKTYFGKLINYPPTIAKLPLTGLFQVNSVLTSHFTPSDQEGDTIIKNVWVWYKSSSKAGPYVNVSIADTGSYYIKLSDKNSYLFSQYRINAGTGDTTMVKANSDTIQVLNLVPVGTLEKIKGIPRIDSTILSDTVYFDKEKDLQGASILQWYRGDTRTGTYTAISGATAKSFKITLAEKDKFLYMSYTPRAATGFNPGLTVRSDTIQVINLVPVGSLLKIKGTPQIDSTITADTVYFDKEKDLQGASTLQWYRGDTRTGAYTAISGATAKSFKITLTEKDKFLYMSYTPRAATGSNPGLTVRSDTIQVINLVPVGSLLKIKGIPRIDSTIVADTVYFDKEKDLQGASILQWYRGDTRTGAYTAISGATAKSFKITLMEKDKFLYMSYTPRATTGSNPGLTMRSDTVQVINLVPVGSLLKIKGTPQIDSTIIADTIYFDKEKDLQGSSTLQWYRGTNRTGSYTAISGATAKSFKITLTEKDKFLYMSYTPRATTGSNPGLTVRSDTVQVINLVPVGSLLKIKGTPQIDSTITADTVYFDKEKDLQGASTFQWYRSLIRKGPYILITGATTKSLKIAQLEKNQHLYLAYTPIAATGSNPGLTVRSDTVQVQNLVPIGSLLKIKGTPQIDSTITADTIFYDREKDLQGASLIQWYSSATRSGSYIAVSGATAKSFKITLTEKNKFLYMSYTPMAATGSNPGLMVRSDTVQVQNLVPIGRLSKIKGTPQIDSTITADTIFYDREKDLQSTSTLQWYRGITRTGSYMAIAGATAKSFKITLTEKDKFLYMAYTPIAATGSNPGLTVRSDTVLVINTAPKASNVYITGELQLGKVIRGKYTYSDAENDEEGLSVYRWYRSLSAGGLGKTLITNANDTNYVISALDTGKYISFEVIPVANYGTNGIIAYPSNFVGPIRNIAPIATNITISGTQAVCRTLTGSYLYSDTEDDKQNGTTFQWFRAEAPEGTKTPIPGATNNTYILTKDDQNKYIFFEVTPRASSGTLVGTPSYGNPTGAILNLLPNVIFSGGASICEGSTVNITLLFTGSAPFTLSYTDGTNNFELNTSKTVYTLPVNKTGIYRAITLVDNLGCSVDGAELPTSANVVVNELPTVDIVGLNSAYSLNGANVTLTGSPAGGVFTGPGVMSNIFYPSFAGVAGSPHAVKYSYTDPISGCSNSDTVLVSIYNADTLITGIRSSLRYCVYDAPFLVTGVNSKNAIGAFSITGNTGLIDHGDNTATVYPTQLGSGQYTISYMYFDGNASQTITKTITIEQIERAQILGLTNFEFCKNGQPLKLLGNYLTGFFSGPGITKAVNGGYYFEPLKSDGGANKIYFTYIAAYGCVSSDSVIFTTLSTPRVQFDVKNNCWNADTTKFLNTSTPMDSIVAWNWNFGDASVPSSLNTSALKSPIHIYSSAGDKTIRLIAQNVSGCRDTLQKVIHLGNIPLSNFTWDKECFTPDQFTSFTNHTTSTDMVQSYKWIIKDTSKIYTTVDFAHVFPKAKDYTIKLIAQTNYGCVDSMTRTLFLRPVHFIKDSIYFSDFEQSSKKWFITPSSGATWQWVYPNGSVIDHAYSGMRSNITKFMSTRETKQLEITSQCFDFTNIKKPFIELKINSDATLNTEGAVLQYKSDGDAGWGTVGSLNSGVNWYTSKTISSSPGNQNSGWSGRTNGWVKARHNLDSLSGKPNIIFRMVYGESANASSGDGFAFDDVLIGQRSKTVLFEHFTNVSSLEARNANLELYKVLDLAGSDAVLVEYHAALPEVIDTLNLDNPSDPAARALTYGIGSNNIPMSRLDGGISQDYIYNFVSRKPSIGDVNIRSLKDPVFDIDISSTHIIPSIEGTIKITALGSFNGKVRVHIAFVEDITIQTGSAIVVYKNVLKKLYPTAAGTLLNNEWTAGSSQNTTFKWTYSKVYNPKNVKIVAFVQDENSGEIYQALYEQTIPTTGIPLLIAEEKNVATLFPNPVSDDATIVFAKALKEKALLKIYSNMGSLIKTEQLFKGISAVNFNVTDLSPGNYLVQLILSSSEVFTLKMVVVR